MITKTVGEVCDVIKGNTGITKAIPGEYPMVALAEERSTHNKYQFDCSAPIVALVSSTGHGHASMNRVHFQEGKFALGSILSAVIPHDPSFLHPKFLHIYFSYFKDSLFVPLMRGAANVSLSMSSIKSVDVVIPSYERQLEIIELEKKLRTKKEILDAKLIEQAGDISKLKESILQEAIEGKLTGKWRKENPNTEPTSELLQRIKVEKEKLIAENKIKKEKPLPPIKEDAIPFELPKSWVWCRLGEITNYGTNLKIEPNEISKDTWVLELEDIEKTTSRLLQKLTFENRNSQSTKNKFVKGQVLYGKLRPYLDKVIVADDDGVCTTEITPITCSGSIDPYFLRLTLKRPDFLVYVNSVVSGMRMPRLQTENGRKALIPLPPLEEQSPIIQQVETLLSKCNELEQQITQSQQHAEMLMQAMLKEAFAEKKQEVIISP